MSKVLLLKNKKFIYNDGNHYRFSVIQESITTGAIYPVTKRELYVHIQRRYGVTFRLAIWSKTFYYHKKVPGTPIKSSLSILVDTENIIKQKILNEIHSALVVLQETPKCTRVSSAFDDFDGFVSVSRADRDKYARIDTINQILK
jgi:hypothetical protein